MIHFDETHLKSMDKIRRLNLVNSISGYKSANLIGTKDTNGVENLAIFSAVVHLGSNPALIGFIMRPAKVVRNTYDNIRASGRFSINHVHPEFVEKAHYTSAKFASGISEFEACGLTPEYLAGHQAPFVKESRLKIGLELVNEIPIPNNGTILLVGVVRHVFVPGNSLGENGELDYKTLDSVSVTGLQQYHIAEAIARFPYARPENVPDPGRQPELERHDNVVFNERSGTYDAALKRYPTDLGAPAFMADDLALWKSESGQKVSRHFKARFEEIRTEYANMVEQVRWNEVAYSARMNFEPVAGELYHLYKDSKGGEFMSLIGPSEWKREHLGSFQFTSDRMWKRMESEVSHA